MFRALEHVSSDSKHIVSVDFQVIRIVDALKPCCLAYCDTYCLHIHVAMYLRVCYEWLLSASE